MGQFADIKAHLRALRDVSEVANGDSGKVVHEVMPDGSIYYGTLDSAGNTDETSKFPSAVALIWRWTGDDAFRDDLYDFTVSNMRYVVGQLDEDGDGWPEGLGNVERSGMGVEKLDNTVYTIRGLRDLADMARSVGDSATRRLGDRSRRGMEAAFESAWWYGGDTHQYADSIDDPANPANDNTKILQRHWIGVTPMDADAGARRPGRPSARDQRARSRGAGAAAEGLLLRRVRAVPHRDRPDFAPRTATPARPATARCRRCRASGRSSRSTPGSWRSPRATSVAWVSTSSSATPPGTRASSSTRSLGDARRDAGDRPEPGLPGQHRAAALRPVDGAAGLGHLRHPVAGRAPAAGRQPRPRARPSRGRLEGAGRPEPDRRQQHPARQGLGRRHGGAPRQDADDDRRPTARRGPADRSRAARRCRGRQGDPRRRTGGVRRPDRPPAATRSWSTPPPARERTRWSSPTGEPGEGGRVSTPPPSRWRSPPERPALFEPRRRQPRTRNDQP